MIHVVCPGSSAQAGAVVAAALQRSCGCTRVDKNSIARLARWLNKPSRACWVLIDPPETWSDLIVQALQTTKAKFLLLGTIPPILAGYLEVTSAPLAEDLIEGASCAPAPVCGYSESPVSIYYQRAVADVECPIPCRPLQRYDFADEWNNLGFGAIRTDGSIWSISRQVQMPPQVTVADVSLNGRTLSAYAGLWDFPMAGLLWFNRPVGPVDSQEWRLVESFIANHRHSELPCWPVLSEIPHGYSAAVTMRLDCDEDVESARDLWNAYRRMGIPFSLAVHSAILADSHHHGLPGEIVSRGGAILSHTATHAPDWGGSYEAACNEGVISSNAIASVTGHSVRYAVSPFHQTPDYARTALADAGYAGCIGGIIRNDPDFLMARAGTPPGSSEGFIGHSQQCMLHGDCMLSSGDSLAIFKQAFDQARAGRAFFGYLDHPFSERYQYGWASEEQRIAMHEEFIAYMQRSGHVLFCNEDDAMDFLGQKAAVSVSSEVGGFQIDTTPDQQAKWSVAVEYAGDVHCLPETGLML